MRTRDAGSASAGKGQEHLQSPVAPVAVGGLPGRQPEQGTKPWLGSWGGKQAALPRLYCGRHGKLGAQPGMLKSNPSRSCRGGDCSKRPLLVMPDIARHLIHWSVGWQITSQCTAITHETGHQQEPYCLISPAQLANPLSRSLGTSQSSGRTHFGQCTDPPPEDS